MDLNQSLFDSETTSSTPLPTSSVPSVLLQQDHQTTRSCLLVAATGLGKTVMMGGLARHWPRGRIMMIAHRFELNQQALKSFEHICDEEVGLEQAAMRADRFGARHRIVVASVQSLNSRSKGFYRFEKFDPKDFGLILIDEAHRAAAETYRRVVDYFLKNNPDLRVVGVTATPDRLDGIGMGCVFQQVVGNYDILWGIQNGYLVEPVQHFVRIDGLDFSQMATRGGDLVDAELAVAVEAEEVLHAMAQPIVQVAKGEQAIVFTASVHQAHRLAELIRDYHFREFGSVLSDTAMAIDGSLSPQDPRRKQIVSDFKAGRIQYLVNCGVATEGFDAPRVRLIAIGRPTKSRALYTQMVGRGTRPLPGTIDDEGMDAASRIAAIKASAKPDCHVLDFIGQAGRHQLICTTDILAGNIPEETLERAKEMQKNDFDGSSLEAIAAAQEEAKRIEEARRKKVTVGVRYELQRTGGTLYDLSTVPTSCAMPGYMTRQPVTESQSRMLGKLGFTDAQVSTMNKRSASAAITHAIENPKNSFGKFLKDRKAEENQIRERQGATR